MEELFDVVDEDDRVVEQRPRSEVHRRKLRHRAVHVFLFRADGRMLIHLRSDNKVEFPSVWTSSASGHVSAGESYDETAPRELLEELGVRAELRAVRKFGACPETCYEFTWLYTAHSDKEITPDPAEIAATRWLTPNEISAELNESPESFSPAFRLLFAAWREESL